MAITLKDQILLPVVENIPEELKQRKQWVLWKAVLDKEKQEYSKVPYQANGIDKASSTGVDTWDTFERIEEAYENGIGEGIGFVLSESDPYACIDIDGLDNVEVLPALAQKIVDTSYAELSPSGTGVHVWIRYSHDSQKFKNKNTKLGYELYDKKRFITVTGESINELAINQGQEITSFIETVFRREEKPVLSRNDNERGTTLSEGDIIRIASKSKKGERFISCLKGGWETLYPSQSEADMSFANDLAFWTNCDYGMMDSIFRGSSLNRDKFDRPQNTSTYGDELLCKAINECTNTFQVKQDDFHLTVLEDLKQTLKDIRFEEIERMEAEWVADGKKGRKATAISPIRCSVILQEHIKFVLFDLEENTRLAMYQPEEGIYTRNVTIIKRVISWLEPKLNNSRAEDVIYHLTNTAETKEPTSSRYLIPVKNGVFNLETKTLEPFTPDYIFTTKISTPYKANSTNPVIDGWDIENWMNSIACGDPEIVTLLWQVINDSLNGNYSRRKAIFLTGEGNNGKGTFQQLVTNLIGMKNIATLKVNEFDQRFRLSMLEGKTACIGDDVPANVYIDDSSNFNSVVTGDVVSVEFKNKPIYNTSFRCSVIQSTNGMPKFKNKTNGTIRRIVIVPFKANFDGNAENFKIKDEYIKDEKVLQYVLQRVINMDFEKFDIPKASLQELEVFKQDNDPVLDFKLSVFDEWVIQEVPKYVVYGFYKKFCNDNGYKHLADRQFHKQLKSYIGDQWEDSTKRYNYEILMKSLGDLDELGIGFPNQSKTQKSYKNTRLVAV